MFIQPSPAYNPVDGELPIHSPIQKSQGEDSVLNTLQRKVKVLVKTIQDNPETSMNCIRVWNGILAASTLYDCLNNGISTEKATSLFFYTHQAFLNLDSKKGDFQFSENMNYINIAFTAIACAESSTMEGISKILRVGFNNFLINTTATSLARESYKERKKA